VTRVDFVILKIPVRITSPVDPSFLWTGRFLGDYVSLDQPADFPVPNLHIIARTHNLDEPNIGLNFNVLHCGSGRAYIAPGAGEVLMAPATFFNHWSYNLERLFGFAINHALARQGGSIMHGAAFELNHRAVLILGLSRGGKSTLSALALRVGARVVSDDTLLASRDQEGHMRVEALRENLYLREPTQTLLPDALQAGLRPASFRGEHRWILDRSITASFTRSVQPSTVLCTTIDRRLKATQVRPMAKADVLTELMRAASPLFLSPRYPVERAATLPVLMGLAMNTSGFRVRLGQDLLADPDATFHRLLDATGDRGEFDDSE